MNFIKTISLILLSIILNISIHCKFTKTYPELIQTGAFSYSSANATTGITITFNQAKSDNNYQQVLSFERLYMPINTNNCFSIYLQTTNKYAGSLLFNINMFCNNTLNELKVRYLIIAAELSNSILIMEIIKPYPMGCTLSRLWFSEQIGSVQVPTGMGSQLDIALILKGFRISNNIQYISLELWYYLKNKNLYIYAKARDQSPKLYFVCVSTIIIKKSMKIYNATATMDYFYDQRIYSTNPYYKDYSNTVGNYNSSITFFGIRQFTSCNSNQLNIYFYFVSINTFRFGFYDQPKDKYSHKNNHFSIQVLNFVFTICPSQHRKYYFPINGTCLNKCPLSYFSNTAQPFICEPCSSTCTTCHFSSTNCLIYANSSSPPTPTIGCNIAQCDTCATTTTCSLCSALYKLADSDTKCVENCSIVDHCQACQICDTLALGINCTKCFDGYREVAGNCRALFCGDGYIYGGEECDDGGKVNRDGCSSNCKIETFYDCQQIDSLAPSVCTLKNITIAFAYVIKDPKSNSFIAYYSVQPILSSMNGFDWVSYISYSSIDITVVGVTFNSQKGRLQIKCTYSAGLPDSETTLIITYLNNMQISHKTIAQNNLSLNYYPSLSYTIATIIEYTCLSLGTISLLIVLIGLIAGKLIALEHIAAYQVTYLCTVTIHNASPTFGALRVLRITLGCISFKDYDYSSNIDRTFKGGNFGTDFIPDCYIGFVFIVLPALIALLLKVLSSTLYKDNEDMKKLYPSILGEVTFYGLLFSSYANISQLFFGVSLIISGNYQAFKIIVIPLIFSIFLVISCYYLKQKPQYFGVFRKKFQSFNICQYFYIFVAVQRLFSSLFIITLRNLSMGLIGELLVIGVVVAFICLRDPYVQGGSRRPLANYAITITNIVMILINNLGGNSSNIIQYLPVLITLLLAIISFYHAFCICNELKEIYTEGKQRKQANMLGLFINKIVKAERQQNVELKNMFQLQYFKNRMMDETTAFNPLSKMHDEGLESAYDKPNNLNEEWDYFTKLHKNRLFKKQMSPTQKHRDE